jgi:hypothetical protein
VQLGQRVEAIDKTNKWLEAFVIGISPNENEIKVHYKGWHVKFDEWLDTEGSKVRVRVRVRLRTRVYGL